VERRQNTKKKPTSNTSQTDWARLDAMQNAQIDFSDTPEITPEMFAKAVVKHGLRPGPAKKLLTLRVDDDVLAWFKSQGRGYQTRINTLLRAYMDANRAQSRRMKAGAHKD
jgi:uncharacterized protein (DUF4415 family)